MNPRGDSHPGLPDFSSISISLPMIPSFNFAAALALARMTSTIWARVSDIDARREETTQRVRTGREP